MVDERTVDVHISWLRGKLESAGLSGDFIKTVYGQAIDLPYHWMAPIPNRLRCSDTNVEGTAWVARFNTLPATVAGVSLKF